MEYKPKRSSEPVEPKECGQDQPSARRATAAPEPPPAPEPAPRATIEDEGPTEAPPEDTED